MRALAALVQSRAIAERGRLLRPEWRSTNELVIMVVMRKASLVHAKAHLSELVDEAEHHNKQILILRHGKPAAALVPVGSLERKRGRVPMTEEQIATYWAAVDAGDQGDTTVSAVDDLRASRR